MTTSILRQLPQSPMRTCTVCHEPKSLDEYYVKIKATGRLYTRCKACHAAKMRAAYERDKDSYNRKTREWQIANPERAREINRRSQVKHRDAINARTRERGADPDVKAKKAAYRAATDAHRKTYNVAYRESHAAAIKVSNAAYYAANPEKIGQRIRQTIARNPDKYKAIHRDWKRANVSACRAMSHRRRAKQKANGGSWTAFEWERLKARCDWSCLMCKRREPDISLCFDHVIPIDLGGFNIISNGQPLCRSCNSKKHRKVLDLRPDHLRYPL